MTSLHSCNANELKKALVLYGYCTKLAGEHSAALIVLSLMRILLTALQLLLYIDVISQSLRLQEQ